jgi:hypothetical protein
MECLFLKSPCFVVLASHCFWANVSTFYLQGEYLKRSPNFVDLFRSTPGVDAANLALLENAFVWEDTERIERMIDRLGSDPAVLESFSSARSAIDPFLEPVFEELVSALQRMCQERHLYVKYRGSFGGGLRLAYSSIFWSLHEAMLQRLGPQAYAAQCVSLEGILRFMLSRWITPMLLEISTLFSVACLKVCSLKAVEQALIDKFFLNLRRAFAAFAHDRQTADCCADELSGTPSETKAEVDAQGVKHLNPLSSDG